MNEATPSEHRGRVLLVDGNPADLHELSSLLIGRGLVVHATRSGDEALRFVASTQPDLILLDVQMPAMSGFEVCERLKASERTRDIPVIFVSAAGETLDKAQAFEKGCADYVTKPFQPEEVLARIDNHLALRRLQRELVAARQRADAANQAKSSFLARVSHELRTPLNAVLGFAQILRLDPTQGERQRVAIDAIYRSGEHLLGSINDILDLAKIEAGRMELQIAPVDLQAMLKGVVDMIRERAQRKNVPFVETLPAALPAMVMADETRLRQVLLNLLSNAVKFTDHGCVHFVVQALSSRPEGTRWRFSVSDTGVGMDEAQLKAAFEPFVHVGDMRHHEEGTGLGLAISRQLAALMGTRIQARSKVGEGSEFFFELQLAVVEAPRVMPAHSRRGYAGPRKKLLLVDDVEDNRAVLRHLLSPLGFELIEAVDGHDCLDKVAAARPDLVVMDLVMPGMNGLDVLRALRRTVPAEALPVMVVSASASDGDAMASLEAGANVFLAKPIVAESLIEELGTLLALEWVHDASSP